jgi:hypothetical protein
VVGGGVGGWWVVGCGQIHFSKPTPLLPRMNCPHSSTMTTN